MLSATDMQILEILCEDAKTSTRDLAGKKDVMRLHSGLCITRKSAHCI